MALAKTVNNINIISEPSGRFVITKSLFVNVVLSKDLRNEYTTLERKRCSDIEFHYFSQKDISVYDAHDIYS